MVSTYKAEVINWWWSTGEGGVVCP